MNKDNVFFSFGPRDREFVTPSLFLWDGLKVDVYFSEFCVGQKQMKHCTVCKSEAKIDQWEINSLQHKSNQRHNSQTLLLLSFFTNQISDSSRHRVQCGCSDGRYQRSRHQLQDPRNPPWLQRLKEQWEGFLGRR